MNTSKLWAGVGISLTGLGLMFATTSVLAWGTCFVVFLYGIKLIAWEVTS